MKGPSLRGNAVVALDRLSVEKREKLINKVFMYYYDKKFPVAGEFYYHKRYGDKFTSRRSIATQTEYIEPETIIIENKIDKITDMIVLVQKIKKSKQRRKEAWNIYHCLCKLYKKEPKIMYPTGTTARYIRLSLDLQKDM